MSDENRSNTEVRTANKVIFGLIASLAFIENTLAAIAFFRNKVWLKKPHNQCILNLVIADILTAIFLLLTPDIVQESNAYSVPSGYLARECYCRIFWSQNIPYALGVTSVYTCVVLAIERWFAVVRPVDYRKKNWTRLMKFIIPLCWLSGFAFQSLAVPRVTGVEGTNSTSPSCQWTDGTSNKTMSWALAITLFVGEILLPGCVITFAYARVFMSFRARDRLLNSVTLRENPVNLLFNSSKNPGKILPKRVTIMICIASLTLILGWLPNQIHFLLVMLGFLDYEASTPVLNVLAILVFLNPCINPVIYVFMDRNFREGFRKLFFPHRTTG